MNNTENRSIPGKETDMPDKYPRELNKEELTQIVGGDAFAGEAYPGDAILERAMQEIGKPYAWGAVGPDSYDCSGLVSYAVSGIHARMFTCSTLMGMPRVSDPQPGDICVSSDHCGVYAGGQTMVHAPTFGQSVCISSVRGGMIFVRP